ncbi:hypothetical protein LTR92_003514 [Exophiala xenobiotica]|nr:hypothetical protein LTR92_003514 [Exophiala xenobiotica]KAK5560374.1 hypothetical protein LTR46_002124 [Exophiala xenobiotica]
MASSQNSPVLIQHSSPPHRLSPEVTIVSISPFNPDPSPLQEPSAARLQPAVDESSSESEPSTPTSEMADTTMVDVPLPEPEEQEPESQGGQTNAGQESQWQQPEAAISSETVPQEIEQIPTAANDTSTQDDPEILGPPVMQQPRNDTPAWVTWDDDLSTPTEDEMTELTSRASRGQELNALDVPSVEKRIYQDVDDPEQRPVKKLRLSWIIKGVRGTREKPNHSRVLISPPANVDGNYWQIKFYPRGNKSVSLSAYIRCSRNPPKPDVHYQNGTFSFFQGPPDADLSNSAAPVQTIHHQNTEIECKRNTPAPSETVMDVRKEQNTSGEDAEGAHTDDGASTGEVASGETQEEDWRVAAQLGMVMYNPDEPRTCHVMSSEHQFAKTNDDWGWTNFVGSWSEIHTRGHLQRAPLLQNDTIAIDAYIRIFDDPTQALWWHSSDAECHWDSKALAGYFPMGTPPLYHSPAVAGMTAWLLLDPLRKILQEVSTVEWRQNSQIRPKPVISHLQMILFLMRHLRKERETYVDLYPAIQAIRDLGEEYNDVKTFWEVFRRTIELELEGDDKSLQDLSAIFDMPDGPLSLPPLPVENVCDIQQSLEQVLCTKSFKGQLPDFLPLTLARQRFDKTKREWRLLHDRVILNEELDLSNFTTNVEHSRYTLYGFVVHVGDRNSGKFYSILRPGGPKTKWLAFEDGDGNKVFSYTRKRTQEFEGLEGQALKDFTSTRQTAYMAMYIKTSRLDDYLPGKLEPYKLPKSLLPHLESHFQGGEFTQAPTLDNPDEIPVELYSDEGILGRQGLLDMFNIKRQSDHKGLFHIISVPKIATYQDLRLQLAQKLRLNDPKEIRLFLMSYTGLGHYTSAQMHAVDMMDLPRDAMYSDQPLCLWYSILKTEEAVKLFGVPDKTELTERMEDSQEPEDASNNTNEATAEEGNEENVAAPDAEQASVQEAVAADLELIAAESQQPFSQPVESQASDSAMQMEMSPPSAEESLTANVPHGHLIDAAAHGNPSQADTVTVEEAALGISGGTMSAFSAVQQAVEASIMAQDVETFASNIRSARISNEETMQTSETEQMPVEQSQGPVDNVYGFIQVFDVDNQNFQVREAFFAKYDDKIKEFVRQRMGYDADKAFDIWRRESVVDGAAMEADDTFRDRRFINGCDLIVGEPISDAKIKQLHEQGKFSNPFDLSKYLRMVDRKHPVLSLTTSEPIELAEFGADYYRGPLVNGRMHGKAALSISSSGHTYEGPLECNKKCGKGGKMTYQNGDTYEGDWEDDERHGQGTFVEHRTGNKYIGGFEYGKRWGMGTTYWQVADEQADLCQICYSQEIDALFFDCGHVCSCVECARQCEICPICRRNVKQVVKMFRA